MRLAVLKETWRAFNADKAPRLASAIAFSAMFALAPLLIVAIAIAGWVIGIQNGGHGHHVAENAILDQVGKGAGQGAADSIRQLVAASFNKPRQSIIAQVAGWITFVVGAGAFFSSLQDALNTVWAAQPKAGGWKLMVRERLASFGMVLAVGFLVLAALGANAALGTIVALAPAGAQHIGNASLLALTGNVLTFLVATLAFALIYKVLPDVTITWKQVWLGAAVTAALFVVGEALVGFYFSVAGIASGYGAAGSLLVLLLWIYYAAFIFLLGAEFTKVVAGGIAPSAQPVAVAPTLLGRTEPAPRQ